MTDFGDVALFDLGEVDDGIDENLAMDDIFTPDWDSKYWSDGAIYTCKGRILSNHISTYFQ